MTHIPKTVVFDLGRVLVQWEPEAFYDAEIGPERRKALFAAVDLYGYNLRIDLGEAPEPVMREAAAAHPDHADEIMMWAERWIELLPGAIDHSVRLLKALKAKGHHVVALTNFGRETLDIAGEHHPFLTLFDQRFVSAELGLAKPDPAIYQVVEEATGRAPKDLLFTDDTAANIDAAAARGWHTHLFTTPQGWADCLVAHGVLTAQEAS